MFRARSTSSLASWVLPTPPSPAIEITPPAASPCSSASSSAERPKKARSTDGRRGAGPSDGCGSAVGDATAEPPAVRDRSSLGAVDGFATAPSSAASARARSASGLFPATRIGYRAANVSASGTASSPMISARSAIEVACWTRPLRWASRASSAAISLAVAASAARFSSNPFLQLESKPVKGKAVQKSAAIKLETIGQAAGGGMLEKEVKVGRNLGLYRISVTNHHRLIDRSQPGHCR